MASTVETCHTGPPEPNRAGQRGRARPPPAPWRRGGEPGLQVQAINDSELTPQKLPAKPPARLAGKSPPRRAGPSQRSRLSAPPSRQRGQEHGGGDLALPE